MRARLGVVMAACLGVALIVYAAAAQRDAGPPVAETARAAKPKPRPTQPEPPQPDQQPPQPEEPNGGGLPPLAVDRDAPLLLDEPAPGETPKNLDEHRAENAACLVCHGHYDEEPLALWHAGAGIGCVKCHGESFAHADDEAHKTPPDVMFPAERIDKSCRQCHTSHDAPAAEVIARWQQRCPPKTDPGRIVCTDCHGRHRLTTRRATWDKRTGELLSGGQQAVKEE